MRLFFRETGGGEPLVILHGLYGSSDNWMTVARRLGEHYHVFLPDLRNHGRSPHSPVHDYPSMVDDLETWAREHLSGPFHLIGHSMGGKVAMFFATRHPQQVRSLISVDISPRTYRLTGDSGTSFGLHKKMMEALLHTDLTTLHTRQEVMQSLAAEIPRERVRQFLLKNLTRDENNRFRWRLNLPVLYDQLEKILTGLDEDPALREKTFTTFPVLFVRGATSGYITGEDLPVIRRFFPQAEIATIPRAGHWLHAEQPEAFITTILDFLKTQQ